MERGVTSVGTFATHNIPETHMHTYRIVQHLHVDTIMYKDTVAGIATRDWTAGIATGISSHFQMNAVIVPDWR